MSGRVCDKTRKFEVLLTLMVDCDILCVNYDNKYPDNQPFFTLLVVTVAGINRTSGPMGRLQLIIKMVWIHCTSIGMKKDEWYNVI